MRILGRIKATALLICLIPSFLIALPLHGVAQRAANSGFEVSSVKVSSPDASAGGIRRIDMGRISLVSMTLKETIGLCFFLHPYQMLGGPNWAGKLRFDIVGKDPAVSNGTTPESDRSAWVAVQNTDFGKLRGLLKDRFALQFHEETRPMPGFVLLTMKGAKFDERPCAPTYRLQHGWVDGEIHMTSLAALLKDDLGAPIEDKTGLTGCYHLQAKWTTDPSDTSLPQIPTMLHDLGLRIQRAKVETAVLVIDHAELPKPD